MAAPIIVQSAASTAGTSAAARSVTLSGVTSGNLLVVCVFKQYGSELAAGDVSDTLSNTYTSIASSGATNYNKGRLWATKSSSSGEVTITVSNASTGDQYWIVVYELSGTPTEYVDQYAVYDLVNTNPTIDLPNTSYADDVLLGFCATFWGSTFTSISSPWELDKTEISIGGFYIHTVKATTSSTGNYDLTVTGVSSEVWTILLVAIKGSVATATALPRRALDGPLYGSPQGSVR